MSRTQESMLVSVRFLMGTLIFGAGWYLTLALRTTRMGENVRSLIIYGITGLPVFMLAVLIFAYRDQPHKTLRHALIFTGIVLLSAMIWAAAEERVAVHMLTNTCEITQPTGCAGLTDNGTLVYRRWPFENHTISFSPEFGWQGND